MVTDTMLHDLTPDERKAQQQSVKQDEQRAQQERGLEAHKEAPVVAQPRFPAWPTSRPGPRHMPPPSGFRPVSALRSEQMLELGYNQEIGEPESQSLMQGTTRLDQLETAQGAARRRKRRLE